MIARAPAMNDRNAAPVWPRIRRWLVPLFGIGVLALLISHANQVDWAGAWRALKGYSPALLLGVLGLATLSHFLYGCFDLIGRKHTGHHLPKWRTWAIAVASYALNLNLGALVGGMALRARLYSRAGVDDFTIAQVIGTGLATNWMGYGVLAGSLFAAGIIEPPAQAQIAGTTLRLLGVALLVVALAYVAACSLARGREWTVRGKHLRLPSPGLAVIQLTASATNWALMGLMMYLLLGQQVSYGTTLGVLMAASVAGVFMPIPGGLGVLEAVYLALLSGSLKQGTILGAILAFRALYYLVPLGGGLLLYAFLEHYASKHPAADASPLKPI